MKIFNKKIIAFLFALSISLTSLPLGIYASPQMQAAEKENVSEKWTEDDFTWDKSGDITVTGLSVRGKSKLEEAKTKKIVIPKTAEAIGGRAFQNAGLKEVIINEGVTIIGVSAFEGNYLTNLELPKSIYFIYDRAFANNRLKQITLPKSLKKIGFNSFGHNRITSLAIDSPDLTEIPQMAFGGNKLKEVTIPDTVNIIRIEAFKGNNLMNIKIQNINKTKIDNFAFYDQSIDYSPTENPFSFDFYGINGKFAEGIDVNGSVVTSFGAKKAILKKVGDKYTIDCDTTSKITEFNFTDGNIYSGKIKIHNSNVYKLNDLDEWSRDDFTWDNQNSNILIGLSSLGKEKIKKQTKLKIPEGTTIIENAAFKNENISEVVFPNSLKQIEARAFSFNKIQKLNIPDSVERIGLMAFNNNEITELKLPRNKKFKIISFLAFANNKIKEVEIPDSVKEIENSAFNNNELDEIEIGRNVTSIGELAFNHNHIRKITISSIATSIGNEAFAHQYFVYEPSQFPMDFYGIGISSSGLNFECKFDAFDRYSHETFSIDGSTRIWRAGTPDPKWNISASRPGKFEFKFDTKDKYQYSGIINIKVDSYQNKKYKSGDIRIVKVGKDDTTKQLEGAEFEIIEIDEGKEEIEDKDDLLNLGVDVDKLDLSLGVRLSNGSNNIYQRIF